MKFETKKLNCHFPIHSEYFVVLGIPVLKIKKCVVTMFTFLLSSKKCENLYIFAQKIKKNHKFLLFQPIPL